MDFFLSDDFTWGPRTAFGMKRGDLQAMSQSKLDDAVLLLENRRYSNAYYLAGYAVEIGLKACVSIQVSAETIPDKEFLKKILNHDFKTLIGLAGLAAQLKEQHDRDADFAAYWAEVLDWSPDARYEIKDATSAQYLVEAVAHPNSGVLTWIKDRW